MANLSEIAAVVDEIYQSVMATPKRQRRLRSSTFWDKFAFKNRTKDRVESVKAELANRNLMVNLDNFGAEDKHDWVVVSYVEPPPPQIPPPLTPSVPTPADQWFELMAARVFESEREVEYFFVVPLLEQLGYKEDDLAAGFPVQMYEGVKKVHKEADFVLFNGPERDKANALLVVEAKGAGRVLSEDATGQARAYAMWLTTPYFLITNGDDVRVYLFRGAVQPDVQLLAFARSDLRQNWPALYQTISKCAVAEYKQKLGQLLAATNR